MSIKVAVIGAGSVGFTRGLMNDMLGVPELQDSEFCFTDLSQRNLDLVMRLVKRDVAHNRLPAKVWGTTSRRRALDGADFVYNVTRIGGLAAFKTDIDIPLKYGVDQCVGDTLCIGGIMYGQRNAAAVLDFCKDIRQVAKPDALLLNYANPNAMNTWVANKYGGVRTIGLCHGVQGGHWQIATVIEFLVNEGRERGSAGYREVPMKEVEITAAGINHQTWFIKVLYRGEDWTGRLLDGFERHPVYRNNEKVRIDMLRRFGYYTTESNGHCSEYVAWYRKRPGEIRKWIAMDSWINGETGGYLRVCAEGRDWFEKGYPKWLAEPPREFGPQKRGQEHGSYIIESLLTGRVYRGHFNVPNNGCITNLPDDAIVEVPCFVDKSGIAVPQIGDLPLGCAAVCNASISVQRLAVEAAVHADVTLLKQSALMDPLTGAACNPNEISQMVDEMLIAQAKWLPQFRKEIAPARARMRREKRLGTRKGRGAARKRTRSVSELKRQGDAARRASVAADKAAKKREVQARRRRV